jgi:hypothetical protein
MTLPTVRFSARSIIILGVVIILFAATLNFGLQIRVYFDMLRYTPQKWWQEAPRPLTDMSVSSAPGKTFSYFGYKFEVPWTGVVRVDKGR